VPRRSRTGIDTVEKLMYRKQPNKVSLQSYDSNEITEHVFSDWLACVGSKIVGTRSLSTDKLQAKAEE